MMPEKYLFEFSVLRLVPKVEREEFINIGVILFSKPMDLISMHYHIDEERLRAFCDSVDMSTLNEHLEAFSKVAAGAEDGGPIAKLDAPSRFRWLTARRSSILQTSRPHPGYTDDLEATAVRLLEELVC